MRIAKSQKQPNKPNESKPTTSTKEDKKEPASDKALELSKDKDERVHNQSVKTEPSEREQEIVKKEDKKDIPSEELKLITLIGQREKLSRDDLTAMMLAGEESLKMLIRKPSDKLIDFIKSHLDDEDAILVAIPRFDMPKADFES